jgi:hypothetical protein
MKSELSNNKKEKKRIRRPRRMKNRIKYLHNIAISNIVLIGIQ